MTGTEERDVDFRVNLEVGVPEDVPEVDTPGIPTSSWYRNKAILGITSVGQEMEG